MLRRRHGLRRGCVARLHAVDSHHMANMNIVGCCGWTEAQPKYFAHFGAIEIQSTFYQPPANAVAQRWKAMAPPGFRFCMKAWQLITHTPASPTYRRLKSGISASERDLCGSFRPTEQVALSWERTRELAAILDADVIVSNAPRLSCPRRKIFVISIVFSGAWIGTAGYWRGSRGERRGAMGWFRGYVRTTTLCTASIHSIVIPWLVTPFTGAFTGEAAMAIDIRVRIWLRFPASCKAARSRTNAM